MGERLLAGLRPHTSLRDCRSAMRAVCRGREACNPLPLAAADNEEERNRIERYNPNPRMPLVRYVGGTWRVGGLLALSRAFGDAYMKGARPGARRDGGRCHWPGQGLRCAPPEQQHGQSTPLSPHHIASASRQLHPAAGLILAPTRQASQPTTCPPCPLL